MGKTLYPLNVLKHEIPEAASNHLLKYHGREWALGKEIPILNCLWNDVLHLSPVSPQIILDTMKEESLYESGNEPKEIEVFKIPVDLIDCDRAVCFQSYNFDIESFDPELDKFEQFSRDVYQEQVQVYPNQIKTWKSDKAAGRRLFWFSHTMHILIKQTIDIDKCELIVCKG